MCSACLDRRGTDAAVLLDAGGDPVAADDEALGAVAEAHGAQPDELLLAGQLVAHPRLAAIRAGQHHARVPGHDAVAARHLHAVEAGVLQRLEEPELLDRAGLDRAALYLPGAAAVARAQHEPRHADHPAVGTAREVDAEERRLRAAVARLPRLAGVRRVVDRPEVADGPRLASVDRLDVVEVVAEDRAGRGARGHRAREREAGRARRPCAARSPRGRHRSRHYTGVLTASIQADGARLRPVASDHAVALEGAEVVRREAEQVAVDLRVVRAEPRRAAADGARRAREARIDALHADGTDDRIGHRHE